MNVLVTSLMNAHIKPTCDTSVSATCSNTQVSYGCAYTDGYEGDGETCIDVDECDQDIHDCDVNADCFNTIGEYYCTCQVVWSITNDNGRTCSNDDECATGVDACSSHAICTAECECNVGLSGSGFECENIDECSDDTNECDENATCTDTVRSYYCACNTGYNQESDDIPLGLVLMTMNAMTEVVLVINIPKSVLARIMMVLTPALVIRSRNTT